jgi:hypothetical protein
MGIMQYFIFFILSISAQGAQNHLPSRVQAQLQKEKITNCASAFHSDLTSNRQFNSTVEVFTNIQNDSFKKTVVLTAMVQAAIFYKREKVVMDPFRKAFGEKADEKFVEAFFQGFSALDENSTYIVYFNGGEREYDQAFYSQILSPDLIPVGSIKLPLIKGLTRLSIKTRKSPKWLPLEIDEGQEIFDFSSPQFSDYESIVEISRVAASNLSQPLENMQFYTPLFQTLASRVTGTDLSKILVVAAAHSEGHEDLWGDWSLRKIFNSNFNFSGKIISQNIILGTSLEALLKRQNEKAAAQFEKLKSRKSDLKIPQRQIPRETQIKFMSQDFLEGELSINLLTKDKSSELTPELTLILKGDGATTLRTQLLNGHLEILPKRFYGDVIDNDAFVIGKSILGEWGRGLTDTKVEPMRVAKLTIDGIFKEHGFEHVQAEVYMLLFHGTLKFFRSQRFSMKGREDDAGDPKSWFDFDLISGATETNYKPFGYFKDINTYSLDTVFSNREWMDLRIGPCPSFS